MTVLRDIDTIILHTPKTGGSSVRWPAINKFGIRYACQHCRYDMIPKEYENFHKMTFIRNPIDWYTSRYFFDRNRFRNKKLCDAMVYALSLEFRLNFNQTLNRMMNLSEAFTDKKTLSLYKNFIQHDVLNNYTVWNVSYHDNIEKISSDTFNNMSYYQWILDTIGIENANSIYRLEDEYEIGMKKEFGNDINLIHKNKTNKPSNDIIYNQQTRKIIVNTEIEFIKKYGYENEIR